MANGQRLIDANRISYHPSGFPKGDGFDSRLDWAFREDIDKAPTVDAVEVVRCKKCAHCTVTSDGLVCERALPTKRMEDYYIYGSTVLARVAPDDFCSHGERRTDHV